MRCNINNIYTFLFYSEVLWIYTFCPTLCDLYSAFSGVSWMSYKRRLLLQMLISRFPVFLSPSLLSFSSWFSSQGSSTPSPALWPFSSCWCTPPWTWPAWLWNGRRHPTSGTPRALSFSLSLPPPLSHHGNIWRRSWERLSSLVATLTETRFINHRLLKLCPPKLMPPILSQLKEWRPLRQIEFN